MLNGNVGRTGVCRSGYSSFAGDDGSVDLF